MGRGVSVPCDATIVTYIDISEVHDEYDFEDMVMNIMETLKNKMPSLQDSDKWIGREDRTILENDLTYIGTSTYCDVMSLWIVPKDQYLALAHLWIYRIAHHVRKLGNLVKDGTMSNGVSVYHTKETIK